jgi:hypothetical protein
MLAENFKENNYLSYNPTPTKTPTSQNSNNFQSDQQLRQDKNKCRSPLYERREN